MAATVNYAAQTGGVSTLKLVLLDAEGAAESYAGRVFRWAILSVKGQTLATVDATFATEDGKPTATMAFSGATHTALMVGKGLTETFAHSCYEVTDQGTVERVSGAYAMTLGPDPEADPEVSGVPVTPSVLVTLNAAGALVSVVQLGAQGRSAKQVAIDAAAEGLDPAATDAEFATWLQAPAVEAAASAGSTVASLVEDVDAKIAETEAARAAADAAAVDYTLSKAGLEAAIGASEGAAQGAASEAGAARDEAETALADVVARHDDVIVRQADVVTRQADVATRQDDVAAKQIDATAAAQLAANYAAAAQAAATGVLYATTAAGVAAVADGAAFLVQGASGGPVYASLYRRSGSSAVAQGLDLPSKAVLDAANIKVRVRVATTADLTRSTLRIIDGVQTVAGDRILVKDKATPQDNGIYIAATGTWARATDFDAWNEIPGAMIGVAEGTANGGLTFLCTAANSGTLNTTPITFKSVTQTVVADITDASAAGKALMTAADATAQRTALSAAPQSRVRLATTGNITRSTLRVIDGVQTVAGDRVLVKDNTAVWSNGIYVVATGSWTRATDMDSWAEVSGAQVVVSEGAANAGRVYVSLAPLAGTLNTTDIVFKPFGQVAAADVTDASTAGRNLLKAADASAQRTLLDTPSTAALTAGLADVRAAIPASFRTLVVPGSNAPDSVTADGLAIDYTDAEAPRTLRQPTGLPKLDDPYDGAAAGSVAGQEVWRRERDGSYTFPGNEGLEQAYVDDAGDLRAWGGAEDGRLILSGAGLTFRGAPVRVRGGWRIGIEVGGQVRAKRVSLNGEIVVPDRGKTIYLFFVTGQSNAMSRAGPTLIRRHYRPGLLMPASPANEVRVFVNEQFATASAESQITGIAPMYGNRYRKDSYLAMTQVEAELDTLNFIASQNFDGWAPLMGGFVCGEGGAEIAALSQGGETGVFENVVHTVGEFVRFAREAGLEVEIPAFDWDHGEANSTGAGYIAAVKALLAQYNAALKPITGQTRDIKMMMVQPSSFSSSGMVRAALSLHREAGNGIFLSGPRYAIGEASWLTDYLHMNHVGVWHLGETKAYALIDELWGDGWTPLYVISRALEAGNTRLRLTFTEDIEIDTALVEPVSYYGVQVRLGGSGGSPYATLSDFAVENGNQLVATASAPIVASGWEAHIGLGVNGNAGPTGQTNPRTAAAIMRTNIRSAARLGVSQFDGRPLHKWACHQVLPDTAFP